MEDSTGGTRLLRWLEYRDDSIANMMRAPGFAAAARALSRNMLAAAAADPALDGIVKDIGRFATTNWAVALDAGDGLTLARLKEICVRSGIASPGRARSILLYLRFLRYIVPAADDGGATRYAPTAACLAAWQAITRAGLDAARELEPAVDLVMKRAHEPFTMRILLGLQAEGGLITATRSNQTGPDWRIVLNRHAGMQIMHSLMLSAPRENDYPPRGPMPLSISTLAKRHKVSRAHVLRLLTAGERDAFLTRGGDGAVALTDSGRTALRGILALRLFGLIYCAARTYAVLRHSRDGPAYRDRPARNEAALPDGPAA